MEDPILHVSLKLLKAVVRQQPKKLSKHNLFFCFEEFLSCLGHFVCIEANERPFCKTSWLTRVSGVTGYSMLFNKLLALFLVSVAVSLFF